MPKRPRAFYRPQTLAEALRVLGEPDTVPLGGGTKLLAGDITSAVVDLQDLELDWIEVSEGALKLGATVRLAALVAFLRGQDDDASPAALLAEAALRAGPNTYRNAATLGGSIAARLPESELLAALLALDATVTLADGRALDLPAFWDEGDGGLIVSIAIPWVTGRGAAERVARTPADTPIVSVCLWQPDGQDARLAATGLDAVPIRLVAAEATLGADGGATEAVTAAAMAAAKAACAHPGDFRGSHDYRREMAGVLVGRVLDVVRVP
jgi:carbon-monoxide dehydrogenase medium subunit